MSENGFADVSEVVDGDLIEGGEGDSAAPTGRQSFDRSPLKVLASLADRPLQQAYKAIEYIDANRERERKLLKACSPNALNLIAQNGAEYLTAVSAISN